MACAVCRHRRKGELTTAASGTSTSRRPTVRDLVVADVIELDTRRTAGQDARGVGGVRPCRTSNTVVMAPRLVDQTSDRHDAGMPAEVRPATVQDAAGIAQVHTLGWQQGFAGLLPAQFLADRRVSTDRWLETLTALPARSSVFVAVAGADVVGFVFVGPVQPPSGEESLGHLYAIYLLADHWGAGVGHALHAAGVAALRDAGFTEAILWSLRENDRTNAFYERHGWRDDNVSRDEMAGEVVLPVRRYRLILQTHEQHA